MVLAFMTPGLRCQRERVQSSARGGSLRRRSCDRVRPMGTRPRSPLIVRFGAVPFGTTISALPRYLIPDAEAEVNQRREADEEADERIEALQGDDGEKAEAAVIRHRIAEDGDDGREHGERVDVEGERIEQSRKKRAAVVLDRPLVTGRTFLDHPI